MNRRAFLTVMLAPIPAANAHTPYGQWVTYRRKHLLIGCHRKDETTYALAKSLVAELDHLLPQASARVARAPHSQRIASLMGTDQLDIAILSVEDAEGLTAGVGAFKPYGRIPIGILAALKDDRVLIAHANFRPDHAWLIASSVDETGLAVIRDQQGSTLDWHDGAKAWRDGEDQPKN